MSKITNREKMKGLTKCGCCAIVVGNVIAIACVCLMWTMALQEWTADDDDGTRHASEVVIYTDTSSTRATLYRWHETKGAVGRITAAMSCGMESSNMSINETIHSLMPCIDDIVDFTGGHDDTSLPVTYMASDDLILAIPNGQFLALDITSAARDALNSYRFNGKKRLNVKTANIITGYDRAGYQWVAANYLDEKLRRRGSNGTIGVLASNAVSVQMSYAYPTDGNGTSGSMQFDLFGRPYFVHTSSQLCFGHEVTWIRHFLVLAENNVTRDPCLRQNEKVILSPEQLEQSICFRTIPGGIKSPVGYEFIGSNNMTECLALTRQVLAECGNYFQLCPAFGNNAMAANMSATFVATGFYYKQTRQIMTGDRIAEQEFISQTLNKCENIDNSENCFNLSYIYNMLTYYYGFGDKMWSRVRFVLGFRGEYIDWPLGLIVNISSSPATGDHFDRQTRPTYYSCRISMALLSIFCLVIIFLSLLYTYQRRNEQKIPSLEGSLMYTGT